MALVKRSLILISIFALLLLLTQCSKATSDEETPSPAPAEEEEEEGSSSPTPAPSSNDEEEEEEDDDDDDSAPTPTANPTLQSGAAADSPLPASELSSELAPESPLSMSELLELSLPEIGVQKVMTGPPTDGAKVSTKQLEGIEHKIVEFKTTLTKREAGSESEESKKCLKQCQGNLDDAIDGVKKGIESINKQDLPKANIDISGVATDIETCNDCFIESDAEDKEINAFNVWIKGVTKECLSNLKET